MPPSSQTELALDQFIMPLSPTELHIHTKLIHPCDLQKALEKMLERGMVLSAASQCVDTAITTVRALEESCVPLLPAWMEQMMQ